MTCEEELAEAKRREAELQKGIIERELWMDASTRKCDQLAARVKTLERLETELQEAVNQAVGMANDHAAELVELTASDARLRGALKACRKWVSAPHPETAAGSINKPRFEADMKLVEDALARTPAQSLAAIRAADAQEIESLKARVKTLEDALLEIANSKSTWRCFAAQALAAKEPKALLKRVSAGAPEGCHCSPGNCMAPVVMGFQTPCRDPRKAAGETK